MSEVRRDEMALAMLAFDGLPTSTNNVQSLVIQMGMEDTNAEWNPTATERGEPGTSDFNPQGVKNYPNISEGLQGWRDTINQDNMAAIKGALAGSNPPAVTCNVITNSPWGTKITPDDVVMILDNFEAYASVLVGGSTPNEPGPGPTPTPTEDDVQVETVQEGSNGKIVKNVQAILNTQAGAGLVVDGAFGNITKGAVEAWQSFWHLTVDGVVGPQTWSTLINVGGA
jgi:hypothetical protein